MIFLSSSFIIFSLSTHVLILRYLIEYLPCAGYYPRHGRASNDKKIDIYLLHRADCLPGHRTQVHCAIPEQLPPIPHFVPSHVVSRIFLTGPNIMPSMLSFPNVPWYLLLAHICDFILFSFLFPFMFCLLENFWFLFRGVGLNWPYLLSLFWTTSSFGGGLICFCF